MSHTKNVSKSYFRDAPVQGGSTGRGQGVPRRRGRPRGARRGGRSTGRPGGRASRRGDGGHRGQRGGARGHRGRGDFVGPPPPSRPHAPPIVVAGDGIGPPPPSRPHVPEVHSGGSQPPPPPPSRPHMADASALGCKSRSLPPAPSRAPPPPSRQHMHGPPPPSRPHSVGEGVDFSSSTALNAPPPPRSRTMEGQSMRTDGSVASGVLRSGHEILGGAYRHSEDWFGGSGSKSEMAGTVAEMGWNGAKSAWDEVGEDAAEAVASYSLSTANRIVNSDAFDEYYDAVEEAVVEKVSEKLVTAAQDSHLQHRLGSAIAAKVTDEEMHESISRALVEKTGGNEYVAAVVGNPMVYSMAGKAISRAATNERVQNAGGDLVARVASSERGKELLGKGIKEGTRKGINAAFARFGGET